MTAQKNNRLLILVQTADTEPWRTIELDAQQRYLELLVGESTTVLWISGTPEPEQNNKFERNIRLIKFQLKASGSPTGFRRKLYRYLISKLRLNALGRRRIKRLFYSRFSAQGPLINGKRIQLPYPNQIHVAGWRTIETYRYLVANYDFDYLLKITSTMLVQPEALSRTLAKLPSSRVFGGVDHTFANDTFKSGAGLLFSRDVVAGIVAAEKDFLLSVYEDVAISFLVRDHNLAEEVKLNRAEVPSVESIPCKEEEWANVHLVRCKPETRDNFAERAIQNMHAAMGILRRFKRLES